MIQREDFFERFFYTEIEIYFESSVVAINKADWISDNDEKVYLNLII